MHFLQAWVVERMGKFHRILEPGLNILLPIVDRVKYVQSLKEIAIDVPKQSAITLDNVTLGIDGVLYLRILDPYLGLCSEQVKSLENLINIFPIQNQLHMA